tara:strand:+ start:830 stop:2029 length:1200 start_codon:yes stop_codon:yes gene_type:complete
MAIKKIVIVVVSPLTKRDFIRFGGEVLKDNGFDVWVYDFSPVAYPKLFKNCTFPDIYRPENYILCSNERQVEKYIGELSPHSFVVAGTGLRFSSETYKIWQALSKTKIPYCVVSNQSAPVWVEKKSSYFFRVLKKISSLGPKALKKIIYYPKFSHLWRIRPADFCIAGSELSLDRNRTRLRGDMIGDATEILWTHAPDYDVYLENKGKNVKASRNLSVFLDPLGPMFQGDALVLDYKVPTTVGNYYPSICRFFDFVEKELDINIEIAAHPKSNHPPYPDYFGGRRTIRGDTFGMTESSRFVITHSSTAFQFAILLKKPVIFLTTAELEKDKIFSGLIKAWANSIGKKPINIDEPLTIDWEKELYVDEKIYNDYTERHIKRKGTEELNIWQILANRLNRV